jgi:hypothetical protein
MRQSYGQPKGRHPRGRRARGTLHSNGARHTKGAGGRVGTAADL